MSKEIIVFNKEHFKILGITKQGHALVELNMPNYILHEKTVLVKKKDFNIVQHKPIEGCLVEWSKMLMLKTLQF